MGLDKNACIITHCQYFIEYIVESYINDKNPKLLLPFTASGVANIRGIAIGRPNK